MRINTRERFFCMIAAGIPDIDGFGILVSQKIYHDYHHANFATLLYDGMG
ncbi:MAG: hypothetical protein PHH77_12750 [Victivallaceae bacterium]|nr:hypothetical protein [Victivallaceae bacterium]